MRRRSVRVSGFRGSGRTSWPVRTKLHLKEYLQRHLIYSGCCGMRFTIEAHRERPGLENEGTVTALAPPLDGWQGHEAARGEAGLEWKSH